MALALALALTLALALAACTSSGGGASPEAGDAGDTITIAVEGPASGEQLATGQDMWNAAQLAVDQANAGGGVAGKTVELLRLDDAADAERGVSVAEQAVKDGIFAVIGPYNSSVGIENLPIYVEGGVVPIHLTSSKDTDGMGYTVQPKDYQVAPIEAAAIDGWLKAKRVAILYDRSSYTAGIAKQLKTTLEGDGVDVVAFLRFRATNLVPGLTVRNALKTKPDLVYASTYFPQGGRIAKALDGQPDAEPTCFMGLANQDPQFVKIAGSAAARNCYVSGVPSPDQFPGAKEYAAAYRSAFGTEPGTWGTFTFDSVNLLFASVEEAGSWDAEAVKTSLSGTADWQGATGSISIDAETGNRDVVPVVVLDVDKKGAFVVDPKWAAFADFELG